jgi:RNA polymerase sigma-70 factor (ECF subfamily)
MSPTLTPDPVAPDRTDIGFVQALDPDALGEHVGRLYRAAYGLCGSQQDAEDLVQETFARVLRRPRFVRRGGERAYLLRVLRNTWISSLRSRGATVVVPAGDTIDDFEAGCDPIEEKLSSDAVYRALQELSEPLREALVAVDVVGLSYRQAARALGIKQGTVMSRLHRGRSQVAASLGPRAAR